MKEGDEAGPDSELVEEISEWQRLTPAEKQSVMLDLRPLSVNRKGGMTTGTEIISVGT